MKPAKPPKRRGLKCLRRVAFYVTNVSLKNINAWPCSQEILRHRPKRCSMAGETRIKKLWYIYTMEYYSAIKRNEIVPFAEMWIDLETVIQSEVSQKENKKYRILTHTCGT